MMEYDIFGGILEIYNTTEKSPNPIAFQIDDSLLYTHPNAKEGLMVTEKETDYICGHTFSG
jgi:acid phosphatase class B